MQALLVFTVIGTIFCLVECINAASLMWNGGHTRLPVELEQGVVLLLEEIPLAACNLSIAACRSGTLTPRQTTAGVLALLSTATRLYVYAYAKRRCFKFEEASTLKATLRAAVYASVTAVWIMLVVINAFTWDHESRVHETDHVTSEMTAQRHHLFGGVAIFILRSIKTPKGGDRLKNALLHTSGATVEKNCLVADIEQLVGNDSVYTRHYTCPPAVEQWPWQPPQCRIATRLRFVFSYARRHRHRTMEPFGEIAFNVAMMTNDISDVSSPIRCTPLTDHQDDWTLHYVNATLIRDSPRSEISTMVMMHDHLKPWQRTCVTPTLIFDPHLPVC
ncbi:hypothetical protein LSAT2_030171 [Lamellibrachia satsuma]|nr:hypothetical protein LSAT2_030171 [Lamellibrachia satsuma]